ncbi:MAG: class I SAM-dependent methyltransferase [Ilumatobacteraceae bacterium]
MGHYFDESPTAPSRAVEVRLERDTLTLRTDRGVFSHGRVDTGAALLLREAPALPAAGTLLDLGCGAGPIALAMARRVPDATVWAIDVNERARALTATNAAANSIGNVTVAAPEDVPIDLRFDAIWSNPPIRVGKAVLHELLATWLERLAPGGHALLVVQRHLGADSLQRWLTVSGWPTKRIASSRGYRLLLHRH